MVPNGADVMRKPCHFLILAAHLAVLRLERRRDPATRRINSADRGVLALAVRSSDEALFPQPPSRAYAAQVARELARNREEETRSWRLAVCDAQGTLRFELLFASMDEAISRLPPVIRFMFDDAGGSTASFNEAIEQVRMTPLSYEDREGGDLGAARRRTQRRGLS